MQILPIDPSFQRVILQGNRSLEGLQLTQGQQIAATVLKINEEGQLLLGFGTQNVWARSNLPLAEGQQLQLRVNQNGATIELQILDAAADNAVENYELATLLQAGAGRGGTATGPPPDPARLLEALQLLLKSESELLTEPQSRQLRALLEPLTVGSDAKALLPQIQNLIENSGVFFEAKLRTILEALNASPEATLQKVASDLKLLLGQLQQLPSPALPTSSSEYSTALAANTPPSLPVAAEQSLPPGVATNPFPPGNSNSPVPADRQSEPTERLAALQTLLSLMKVSPDRALQKLSTEVAALLQPLKPEQVSTQSNTSPLETLLKQAGSLGTAAEVPAAEPLSSQKQIPSQSGEVGALPKPAASAPSPADESQGLDHKVRQLLEAVRSTPEPDVRKLLPELAALLPQAKEQALSTLPEAAAAHGKSMVLEQTAILSDQVLSRQADAAFQWLKNGAFQADVPMQFGTHSTQATIRFFQETDDKDAKKHSGRPLNINIYLDLPDTGKLEAWARWEGSQIQTTLYVRDAATRELFESQLQELSTSLREAGFSTAVLDVRIDPARLYKMQDNTEQTLPQEGSLLSLRV
jgi:Flagellar hook-length control protein FliK